MTPSRQQAESQKYIAVPHIIIPTESGYEAYSAYGAKREYIGLFEDATALAAYFSEQFSANLAAHKAKPSFIPRSTPLLDFDLDLDLELDL